MGCTFPSLPFGFRQMKQGQFIAILPFEWRTRSSASVGSELFRATVYRTGAL